jgi:hypothetical protein
VPALANQLGRLVGALHDNSPKSIERRFAARSLQSIPAGAPAAATRRAGALYGCRPTASMFA